jgi:drug/metabolite transporter (DMT)-like permease
MIIFLRGLFLVVLASMIWVTSWASLHQALGDFARGPVIRDPWVIATLLDAYWAFIAFYVWVAWKERHLAARVLWLVSLLALGNLAIAAYMLGELFKVPATGPLDPVFSRRNAGSPLLPACLTAASIAVYLLA